MEPIVAVFSLVLMPLLWGLFVMVMFALFLLFLIWILKDD